MIFVFLACVSDGKGQSLPTPKLGVSPSAKKEDTGELMDMTDNEQLKDVTIVKEVKSIGADEGGWVHAYAMESDFIFFFSRRPDNNKMVMYMFCRRPMPPMLLEFYKYRMRKPFKNNIVHIVCDEEKKTTE